MAEERCPMCGKLNPEDLEICQYCQARLKPLIISPPPEDDTEITPSSASFDETPSQRKQADQTPALPDWLQPDWLQSLRQGGGTDELGESESEDELPDWSFEEGNEEQEAEPSATSSPGEDLETSDWLEGLRKTNQSESETPGDEDPDQSPPEEKPDEEIPDWLQRIRARQSTDEPEIPPEKPDAESAEFLAKLRASPPSDETAPPEVPGPEQIQPSPDEEDVQIPDWLADFAEKETESTPPELPDWLKSGAPAFTEEGAEPSAEFPSGLPSSQPPFIEPFLEEGEVEPPPEMPSETLPSQPPFTEPLQEEGTEEEAPDWLQDLEIKAGLEPKEEKESDSELEVVTPFTFDDESADLIQEEMPDWITEIPPTESPIERDVSQVTEEDLEPAELPTWLEAMRPVEAIAPSTPAIDERDRIVESSGPLAGLQGILPAEPEIAREKKSPVYSVKLQLSESQQSHASLLAEMVKAEGIAAPVPRAPTISSQTVLRIALFLILLVSIVWPVLSGDLGVPTPELPAEIIDASMLVSSIPDGGNVLLAVDYQPGFSGEMNATTASLLDHLMIKGAYLTLVSTSTTGPAQAERLVRYINNQMGHQYRGIGQYANLGYIGGGLSGLRSFAESPQQIMPYALNVSNAEDSTVWINGRLSNVQTLSDFVLTVVITDSPESARNWIEQVGPALADSPLLLVVSAQAEPFVRPYYEGYPKQAKGLVVGVSGGMAYESSMPRPAIARRFWNAYSYGLPAAVLLILIGGLVNIVLTYLPTLKQGQGGAKG